jgi:hypothetical protein
MRKRLCRQGLFTPHSLTGFKEEQIHSFFSGLFFLLIVDFFFLKGKTFSRDALVRGSQTMASPAPRGRNPGQLYPLVFKHLPSGTPGYCASEIP